MISMEEKERLIRETKNRLGEIVKQGINDEDKTFDAMYDMLCAYKPLMEAYNEGIMEVINPMSEFILPILVYLFKTTAAALESELENHENSEMMKMLLQHIESCYRSISFNRPA